MVTSDSLYGIPATAAVSSTGHPSTETKTTLVLGGPAKPLDQSPAFPASERLSNDQCADYKQKLGRLKEIEGLWFEASELLLEFREKRLYREHYPDFETFCRRELDMGKSNCNRIVRTGEVAQLLATNVAKPKHEAHVRPLLRLKDGDQQVEAYRRAEKLAKDARKPLTAVIVTRAVRDIIKDGQRPEAEKASSPDKGELITQISRALRHGLLKLTPDQLSAFDKACQEFKAEWLRNLPPEPPTAEDAESTEAVHAN